MFRLLLLLLLAVHPSVPWAADAAVQRIQAEWVPKIERELRRSASAGVALVLVERGRILWLDAYGYADRASRTPLRTDQRMPVGAQSQLLIALATLALAERGRLDLDAPLSTLLPELSIADSDPARPLTVRWLLTHHSGLSNGRLKDLYTAADTDPVPATEPLLRQIQPPGLYYAYSVAASALLVRLLEGITGTPFLDHAERTIVRPLGLPHASHARRGDYPRPHRDGRVRPLLLASDAAALGWSLSIEDLARLAQLLTAPDDSEHNPILSPASVRALYEQQNAGAELAFDQRYGYGFSLNRSQREAVGDVARSYGAAPGFRSELRIVPRHGIAAAVLANSTDDRDLVSELAAGMVNLLLNERHGIPLPPREPPTPEVAALPRGTVPDAAAAHYSTPAGELRTRALTDGFDFAIFGQSFRATRRADDWLRVRYKVFGAVPVGFGILNRLLLAPVRQGDRRLLLVNAFGSVFLLGSAFDPGSLPAAPVELAGRYRLVNGDLATEELKLRELSLVARDGLLLLRIEQSFGWFTLSPEWPLRARAPDRLELFGTAPFLGEVLGVERTAAGPVLDFGGYRLERVGR